MKQVIIDRAMWNSGLRLAGISSLCNNYGQKCCLGFLGEACGIEEDDLMDEAYPVVVKSRKWPKKLFAPSNFTSNVTPTQWENVFAELNDFKDIDHATREAWITEGFKRILKREVVFTGEYIDE